MGHIFVHSNFHGRNAELELSDKAYRLMMEAPSWLSRKGLDREFPRPGLAELNGLAPRNYSEREAEELVSAGLWEATAGGWLIVDPLILIDPTDVIVPADFEELSANQ